MSACVKWAKEEVDAFNLLLARQLSSADEGAEVWTQCMNRAKEHAMMLNEVGLDFRNLVGRNVKSDAEAGKVASRAASTASAQVGLGLS